MNTEKKGQKISNAKRNQITERNKKKTSTNKKYKNIKNKNKMK